MGIKAYIPGTKARQSRLFSMSLAKQLGKNEVLLQIEYPDGTEQHKPANWNADINAWQTTDDQRYFSKGFGGDPGKLNGVPIVHVDAINAGVPSREAAKIAAREQNHEYVDDDGRELEVVAKDEHGAPTEVRYPGSDDDEIISTDGGEINLNYDMSPPEGYQGEVISRRLAGYFDPYPVSRQEADQAVEHAQSAAQDTAGFLKTLLVGFGLGLGSILLFVILLFVMGQIGGGDGGGGTVIPAMIANVEMMI